MTPKKEKSRIILHADMDAFYASVEQRDFPEYRGKPVIVGADPKEGKGRGVVAAASYEARKFGVHSALPISQAFKLCPHGVFVKGRGDRYFEVSQNIMSIFNEYTPLVEPISLDEAFLDLTGTHRLWGSAGKVAEEIQHRIFDDERLTISIGLAPNKLLAKMASEINKPNGYCVVKPDQIKSFLAPMPIKALWGVGKQTEKALHKIGIHTIGELADYSKSVLESNFGKHGGLLYEHANGIDDRPVISGRDVKSVSNEFTFSRDSNDMNQIHETLLALSEKVSRRLRKQHLRGRTICLKVRYEDFTTRIYHTTLNQATHLGNVIFEEVAAYLELIEDTQLPVRLLGVGVSQLTSSDEFQTSMFEEEKIKQEKVYTAMDCIQKKFGTDSIKKGTIRIKDYYHSKSDT